MRPRSAAAACSAITIFYILLPGPYLPFAAGQGAASGDQYLKNAWGIHSTGN